MSTVYIFNKSWYDKPYCRCSSSVEHQLPKLRRRVRFPSSARKSLVFTRLFLFCVAFRVAYTGKNIICTLVNRFRLV